MVVKNQGSSKQQRIDKENMATVQDHYKNVLSDVYSWMFGGFESGLERNRTFFKSYNVLPCDNGVAIDLGAGCGFQSIPLAELGYSVTAIDLDEKLLDELQQNRGELSIKSVQANLLDFQEHVKGKVDLMVCMTDTIVHLETKEQVITLFKKVADSLNQGGRFIITFRELTFDLEGTDRFLPVRSDDSTIFTCFLEYEPETVKVHDIVYRKENDAWSLHKSYYRKLRLSQDWVKNQLLEAGFSNVDMSVENGLVVVKTVI